MAAISTIVAVASLTVATTSAIASNVNQNRAERANRAAANEQKKANSEQVAMNAAKAAQERRQQVREARVRQGKLMQAAENTGTAGSSGELGAMGGMATQLGANIGTNLGMLAGQSRANAFNQAAADYQTEAQSALSDASSAQNLFSLSTTIFNANGGKSQLPKFGK